MQLKTSSFNKGIYFSTLKRFWLIGFSFAFLLALNIIEFLNFASGQAWGKYATYSPSEIARVIFSYSDVLVIFLFPFFSLITALAVFSYIHYQRNTAMIHALPISRSSLFTTHFLSGLTLVLLPLVICGAILVIGEILMGITHIGYSLLWVLVSAIVILLLYSFAVFAGMFTGHMAAHALFFLILNFLAVFLEAVINTVLTSLLFGYVSSGKSPITIFSPIAYLEDLFSGFSIGRGNYVVVICYLLAGLIFTLGARAIYMKRHMETAGDVISLSFMKPVFKYGVAFCSSALLGNIIVNMMHFGRGFPVFVVSYLIGVFIGYYAAEILLKKTFRVFRSRKGFLIFALVIVILISGVHFDFFGYETYVPDSDDVEIMYVGPYMDQYAVLALMPESYEPERHRYLFMDYDNTNNPPTKLDEVTIQSLRLRAGVLEKPETIEKAVALHQTIARNASIYDSGSSDHANYYNYISYEPRYFNLSIVYRLKSGRIVERAYYLPNTMGSGDELETSLLEFSSSPEVMEKFNPLLTVEADDLNFIHAMFYEDKTSLNLTTAEELDGFLAAYKKDIREINPVNYIIHQREVDPTGIEVTFSFKENIHPFNHDRKMTHMASGKTWTIQLMSDNRHTIEYLVTLKGIKQETLQ